jgi:threonine/homoserine/homoserine lactone efflux protein
MVEHHRHILLDEPDPVGETGSVVTALLTFAAAGALVVLIPGPDTLVMLRSVVLHGRRSAALTALGILTGLSIWASAAAIGLTALLRASHDGYLALRLAGAAYLLYFGAQALRNRAAAGRPAGAHGPAGADPSAAGGASGAGASGAGASVASASTGPRMRLVGKGFRAGLTTDLLNPKVGVFFITFLPAFIPHGAPAVALTFGLGAIFVTETAIYLGVMLVFVDRLTRWLRSDRFQRRLNRVTGLVLIGFGVRLAVEG